MLALIVLLAICNGKPVFAAEPLKDVLAKLDVSAQNFKSAQADINWDTVQTAPVPDTVKQVGTVVFERKNGEMQVAIHLKTNNGQPAPKDIVYAGGIGKEYEGRIKQLQIFHVGDKKEELETFLTLGFGGSGANLEKSWNMNYVGTEQVNGVSAAKLQLAPRDPNLVKSAPKVLLWIDTSKGVALKQQRFDADGNYVVLTYSNIRVNASVPSGAFDIKTAPGTQTINH